MKISLGLWLAIAGIATISLAPPASASAILYVSNFNGDNVTAYTTSGRSLGTVVQGGPELRGAVGLAFGADSALYVAGQFSNTIVRYNVSTGKLEAMLASGAMAGLSSPQGLTMGPDGLIYAASFNGDSVTRYDPRTGRFIGQFASAGGNGHDGLQDPVFGPDGNLYVSSYEGHQILRFNGRTGSFLGSIPAPAGAFSSFVSFAFGADGNIYSGLVDPISFTGEVARFSPAGKFLGIFVPPGSNGLDLTGGIAFGPDGNLYLASVRVDSNFRDTGSSILRFDGKTGASLGTFVGAGNGLDVPFSMTFQNQAPEPATFGLLSAALLAMFATRWKFGRRSKR